jgi:photosystem II stability/assembly factor-like uncharacterized protein
LTRNVVGNTPFFRSLCDIGIALPSTEQMRTSLVLLGLLVAAGGCKKDSAPAPSGGGTGGGGGSGTGGGSGGGGGKGPTGWLVGNSAVLAHVGADGSVAYGNAPIPSVQLNNIACRYEGEAWVVGNGGTLLYTNDGGTTWTSQQVPATADLRAVGTQDDGPVFVVGNSGTFLESDDTGATWRNLGDGVAAFRSIAAAQDGGTVLAISDDGGVWSYDGAAITRTATLTGARAVALSPDGMLVLVVGTNAMWTSSDAGVTWTSLTVGQTVAFDDVRLDQDGNGVAVGTGGAVALVQPNGEVVMNHAGTADLHTVHIGGWGAVGEQGYTAGEGGQVYTSVDGGWTWELGPNIGQTLYGVDSIGDGHR